MTVISSTKVRNEWSAVSESVIREKPAFIKKTRDYMFLSNLSTLEQVLSAYSFNADIYIEDDGTITLSLREMDIAENAKTRDEGITKLASSILEYASEFYEDYAFWAKGDRIAHIPYVLKALILNDIEKVGGLIQCHHGEI